jgi:hypothetical protein
MFIVCPAVCVVLFIRNSKQKKREGWQINAKRVYRLYKLEGLNLRNKSRRKTVSQARVPNPAVATKKNECWAMDFGSDQLYNGKKLRSLTLIDTYIGGCLAIYPEKSIKGEHVAAVLDGLKTTRGLPKRIKVLPVNLYTYMSEVVTILDLQFSLKPANALISVLSSFAPRHLTSVRPSQRGPGGDNGFSSSLYI